MQLEKATGRGLVVKYGVEKVKFAEIHPLTENDGIGLNIYSVTKMTSLVMGPFDDRLN